MRVPIVHRSETASRSREVCRGSLASPPLHELAWSANPDLSGMCTVLITVSLPLRRRSSMRRIILALVLALTTAAVSVLPALAGNPHFVTLSATRSGNTLIVTGKEAGLGDEQQVNIEVNASASCINPGSNHP